MVDTSSAGIAMRMRTVFVVLGILPVLTPSLFAAPGGKEGSKERLQELQRLRVKLLEEQLQEQSQHVKLGKEFPIQSFIDLVRELGDARLELAETPAQRVAACERVIELLREREDETEELVRIGLQTRGAFLQIKAGRVKAE